MLGGLDYHSIAAHVRRALNAILSPEASQDGYALISNQSSPAGAVWLSAPPGQGILINGKITVTPNTPNAGDLTIALKGADGNDPSASNPVFVAFRSATLTDGGFTVRKITAALSIVVSSGSTLGHASGSACHLFVYLIDNSGTVELAVSNLPPDYPGTFANTRLISTTAEGGAGAADSATGIYSTTARSNVPWVCVAMMKSTQTTAGTWAANMTQVDQAPFRIPSQVVEVKRGSAQNISSGGFTKCQLDSEVVDSDAIYDNVTNYRLQPNIAGDLDVTFAWAFSGPMDGAGVQIVVAVYKNGVEYRRQNWLGSGSATIGASINCRLVRGNGTTDYYEFYAYQDGGGTEQFATDTYMSCNRISGGQ